MRRAPGRVSGVALALCLIATSTAARGPAKPPALTDAALAELQSAVDEHRYADAERMLSDAAQAGLKDARLNLIAGDVALARRDPSDALAQYHLAEADSAQRSRALEGEGISLASLGRAEEALKTLKATVAADPDRWRAWNALGVAYDDRGDFANADVAYFHALAGSGGSPLVFNNRGYSHLLRRQTEEAITDFVAALRLRPDFAEARTNLRLALALKGDIAAALEGASEEDRARLLNNAGFAAGLAGDYAKAIELLTQAISARGTYYDKASENLRSVENMKAHDHGKP